MFKLYSLPCRRSRFGSAALMLAALACTPRAQAEPARCSHMQVIKSVDNLLRANGQVALFEMRVVRPRTTRTLRMRFWFKRGRRSHEDRALARVDAPSNERGVASLRLGNKMWSFVPNTGRVQQVPESMMLGSWMGSDWTNDDLVKDTSLLEDYRATSCQYVDLEGPAYRVELQARKGRELSWDKMIIFARRGGENDLLPLRQEFFSKRAGELVLSRTMRFADFRDMGGRRLPARMILQSAGRPGRRTELRYLSIQFDADIPERIFSLNSLQRAR